MRTTAAVSHEPRAAFAIEEVDLPDPGSGELLVRIVATGLCHTDLASRDGLLGAPFPAIFGHEGAGVVEAIGEGVTKVAVGDHVVLAPMSDGTCRECQEGAPMYCTHFDALNFQTEPEGPLAGLANGAKARIGYFGQSSFAFHAVASERNAVKVPKDADLALLGPLGCGIQTGAETVMNGLKPQPGSSIAIIGTGAVGLAAILGAVVSGCATIIAIDRVESRLELARSLGATDVIDTGDGRDLGAAIRAIVPHGVDYVVDAAGGSGRRPKGSPSGVQPRVLTGSGSSPSRCPFDESSGPPGDESGEFALLLGGSGSPDGTTQNRWARQASIGEPGQDFDCLPRGHPGNLGDPSPTFEEGLETLMATGFIRVSDRLSRAVHVDLLRLDQVPCCLSPRSDKDLRSHRTAGGGERRDQCALHYSRS